MDARWSTGVVAVIALSFASLNFILVLGGVEAYNPGASTIGHVLVAAIAGIFSSLVPRKRRPARRFRSRRVTIGVVLFLLYWIVVQGIFASV
ncbi:MAG: hypothetical protein JW940_32480 [Polyangiaceae bacterium]|nr:hypothetical protein [Polyangiaceae bacterium]